MTDYQYRLNDVAQRYGGRTVLAIDRLEIRLGEVLCLVGPTGAGKSTLLRLLGGLEPPAAGDLWFQGSTLALRDHPLNVRRGVTLVFQRPLLLSASVRANVEYGLKLRRDRRASKRVDEVLDHLDLTPLAARPARALSGGETQLVALARALVLKPNVLLLDEPTAHLGPARVALVESVIAAVHREHRPTIVWATHNLFQARRMASRVGALLDGRLAEVAPTARFFESPDDPRTAAFVRGEMVY